MRPLIADTVRLPVPPWTAGTRAAGGRRNLARGRDSGGTQRLPLEEACPMAYRRILGDAPTQRLSAFTSPEGTEALRSRPDRSKSCGVDPTEASADRRKDRQG